MLAHRVIPTLLYRGEQLVKGKQFQSWRSVGHVQQAARIYAARGVDELCILDVGATPEDMRPNFDLVARIADGNFAPLTVGGGVRSVQDVRDLLNCGADKVAICTAVCEVPDLVSECADWAGCQSVVVAIDVGFDNTVMIGCGRSPWTHDPVGYAQWAQEAGAGEILLTSIDREGTMTGYDLDLIRAVSAAVDIPVIAHGGCSGYADMSDAIRAGASAVAAGALFQFTDATPKQAAAYLNQAGLEARVT